MIEGVPVEALNGAGVVGIALLVAIAIARGWLVTAREVERIEHDRDEWRAESRLKDAQLAEKDKQLEHMGEVGRLQKAILGAVQRWQSNRSDEVNQ